MVESSAIETNEKIAVVQSQIETLRKESQSRMDTGQKIWQLVIGGLAAVLVLKRDTDLARYFALAPVIGMLLLAHYLREYHFLFRDGRFIERLEAKINKLAGEVLISSETTLRQERKKRLGSKWTYVRATVIITGLYFWFLYWLVMNSQPASNVIPGFRITLFIISVFTYEYSLKHLWLIYKEIHSEIPSD